ncbi:MAG: hypothetical protein AB1689_16885 [Thermodesulfobacteriota bacterium]
MTAVASSPLASLLAYLVLFAALSLRWLASAAEGIPINTVYARGDTRLLTWILWWVSRSITGDAGSVLDAPINYPATGQLTGSEHFAALQLLFFPAFAATGNAVLAVNLVLFLAYPLAAWLMSRLLVGLRFDPLVACVVGLAFALGAHQVPTHVHQMHVLPLYLPAVALALHRLREAQDARALLPLVAVFGLACLTAYYTVAVLVQVVVLWTGTELLRRRPGRLRFALQVGIVVTGCLGLLWLASRPYLMRARLVGSLADVEATVRLMAAMSSVHLRLGAVEIFGAVSLVLAVAGCAGLLARRRRPIALLGIALVAAGAFLVCGGGLTVVSALPPSPLTDLLRLSVTFIRALSRYAVIVGFGVALLGAVGLHLATRALPRAGAAILLAFVALAVVGERGRRLWTQDIEHIRAVTSDAPVYARVAAITAQAGRGPLLELPLSSFGYSLQPEAMMGSMQHELPLVSGHTGYLPPHRPVVDATIERLPAEGALQDLVDMTRVGWILLRPARYWADVETRASFARELTSLSGVGPAWEIDGWTLLAVRREPRHADWFDAIARGDLPREVLATRPAPSVDRQL